MQPKSTLAALGLAACLLAPAPTAGAQSYVIPPGLYAFDGFDKDARNHAFRCAFFFDEERVGGFASYVIDLAAFRRDGIPRYRQFTTGTCEVDHSSRIYACNSQDDALRPEPVGAYWVIIDASDPSRVRSRYFFDQASMEAWKRDKAGNPLGPYDFVPCPFDRARLAEAIVEERTPLTKEQIVEVLELPETASNRSLAHEIYRELGVAIDLEDLGSDQTGSSPTP